MTIDLGDKRPGLDDDVEVLESGIVKHVDFRAIFLNTLVLKLVLEVLDLFSSCSDTYLRSLILTMKVVSISPLSSSDAPIMRL